MCPQTATPWWTAAGTRLMFRLPLPSAMEQADNDHIPVAKSRTLGSHTILSNDLVHPSYTLSSVHDAAIFKLPGPSWLEIADSDVRRRRQLIRSSANAAL